MGPLRYANLFNLVFLLRYLCRTFVRQQNRRQKITEIGKI